LSIEASPSENVYSGVETASKHKHTTNVITFLYIITPPYQIMRHIGIVFLDILTDYMYNNISKVF